MRSALAAILIMQLAEPAGLRAQMAGEQPQSKIRAASSHPTTPLSNDERVLHVLSRFTYGPRPGDIERVRAMGLNGWFKQQLNPQSIDDSALEARLESYPAMRLPLDKLMEDYPTRGMVRATMNGRAGIPRGEAEKAIYNDQMTRQKAKKDGKDQAQANEFTPLPEDQVLSILGLPPDKRFSALCKMKPAQLRDFRQSLSADQRQHVGDGFTPEQIEELAAFNNPQAVVAAEDMQTRLLREIYSERQLNEVMTDFWLNHFNVYMRKNQQAPYYIASYERDVIRPRALGRFEDLLVAVASSPAMLSYLDNASSIGPHSFFATRPVRVFNPDNKRPVGLNENYARELMELHTVGVNGGYTQKDVTEVAKVFTGWTVGSRRPGSAAEGQAEYDPMKHEPGSKQVLGTKIKDNGEKEGIQVLHMLATSPKTARFISTKLAVRFVSDDPPPAMIDRMAKTFQSNNGDIRRVLLAMINSPEFFSRENYRVKLKTPQDFVVSAIRASGTNIESPGALVQVIADLGMPIYGMQTPNGYSMKADAWNNTAALIERMNFALALASNRVAGVSTDWQSVLGADTSLTAEEKTALLEDKLLHVGMSDRSKQAILSQVLADPAQRETSLRQVAAKDRRRDPLAMAGSRHRAEMAEIDTESALAAGLLLGSPEFQRR
jgi:uncharacterized protein (DUF1800 family)